MPEKIKKSENGQSNPCIWMQANVVDSKNCNNFFDCVTCKYDAGMQKQVEKRKKISWQDAMRRRPELERVCRHSLTKRIERRVCAYDYQCSTCDFDQFFEDILTPKAKALPSEMSLVKGFKVPTDYYFHNGHTWAKIESGGYIRVGLDDFSLKLFGKADGLDLPLMGKELDKGNVGWGLKRRENIADILSPVDGVITDVNLKIKENPELANQDPYGDGWLFMVRTPNLKKSVQKLMTDTDSLNWTNEEVTTLENMIEDVAGPLAADGGFLGDDIIGNLTGIGWNNLTKTFLKTGK